MNTSTQEEINTSTSEIVSILPQAKANVAPAEIKAVKPNDAIYELCNSRRNKLLPFLNNNSMQFEKLARSFAWEINTNDKLKCCNPRSMVDAFYKCCEYGLDPASSLGQAWLIPYKGNIDLQIGYRGWLKLLWSNPNVTNVFSYPVYEDDTFNYEMGMEPKINKHVSPMDCDKSIDKLVATYGVVKFNNGEAQVKICLRDEIDQSYALSRSSTRSDSPWNNHFEAMALVVPIRKMAKNLGLTMRADEFDDISNEAQNIQEMPKEEKPNE